MEFKLSDNSSLKGLKLILLYPNKVPPHIFIVSEGKFFDLKYNKSSVGTFQDFEQGLIAKGIPMLHIHTSLNIVTRDFEQHFKKYKSLTKELTCLSPIRDFLQWTDVKTIFDFIQNLDQNGVRMEFSGHNIKSDNKVYEIKEYGEKEIKSYIQTLKNQ